MHAAILTLAVVASATAAVFAQAAPTGADSHPQALHWNDGLVLDSAHGWFHLQAASLFQLDTHTFADPRPSGTDAVLLRRLRTNVNGRLGSRVTFRFLPELAQSRRVFEAFVDVRVTRALHLRVGKDRPPVGYEMSLGAPYLVFPERSLLTTLVPNRDVGLQILGDAGRISYAAGLFNESPDGTNGPFSLRGGGHGEWTGRVVLRPFSAGAGRLRGLKVQLAGTRGTPDAAPTAYRTAGRAAYFRYAPGVTHAGVRDRLTPAVSWFQGRVGAYAEAVRSSTGLVQAGRRARVTGRAWEATGIWVLTGEAASERELLPRHPVSAGGWGALQLEARLARASLGDGATMGTLGATGTSRLARATSLGATWLPTHLVRLTAAWDRTSFDPSAPAPRPTEQTLTVRYHVAF